MCNNLKENLFKKNKRTNRVAQSVSRFIHKWKEDTICPYYKV